jgi:hypothetical protein
MSEAKVGLSANVWVEVVGLFMVVLDFVNAFGFVSLHVLKPARRINVSSINMLFGIAACYSRESAPAMPSAHPQKQTALSREAHGCGARISVRQTPSEIVQDPHARTRVRVFGNADTHSIRGAITRTAEPSLDRCVRRRGLEGSRP